MTSKRITRFYTRVYFSLWTALLLFFASFFGTNSAWRVMRIDPPRWTEVPGAVEFVTPHEHVLEFFIGIWHGMLEAAATASWIDPDDAAELIANGASIAALLRFLAGLCVLFALWQISIARFKARDALSVSDQPSSFTSEKPATASMNIAKEPVLPQAVIAQDRLNLMSRSVSQAGLAVTNLMLDPQAQQFAEELADAATKLQAVSQELAKYAQPASGT
jgi:hypothetical protein